MVHCFNPPDPHDPPSEHSQRSGHSNIGSFGSNLSTNVFDDHSANLFIFIMSFVIITFMFCDPVRSYTVIHKKVTYVFIVMARIDMQLLEKLFVTPPELFPNVSTHRFDSGLFYSELHSNLESCVNGK